MFIVIEISDELVNFDSVCVWERERERERERDRERERERETNKVRQKERKIER